MAANGASDTAAARVARYRERRNPAVDRLLPAGEGGTRFFEHLDGNAGMAFPGAAAIGIVASGDMPEFAESVELHERAHLLQAFLPQAVNALLARIRPAAPGEYATRNHSEHFAEMAATAWDLIVPPSGFCWSETPLERLADAEKDVPGTAGFVAWYLRQPVLLDIDGREQLRTEAEKRSAPLRAEWENIWTRLQQRRLPDGTFERWHKMTVREYLESVHTTMRMSDRLHDRLLALVLVPSLGLLKMLG